MLTITAPPATRSMLHEKEQQEKFLLQFIVHVISSDHNKTACFWLVRYCSQVALILGLFHYCPDYVITIGYHFRVSDCCSIMKVIVEVEVVLLKLTDEWFPRPKNQVSFEHPYVTFRNLPA